MKNRASEGKRPGTDIYASVTESLLQLLEAGVRPWQASWDRDVGAFALPLRANGIPYTGINVLSLWAAKVKAGYRSNRWMTLNQANALGGTVMKGQRGTLVVYTKVLDAATDEDEQDEDSGGADGKQIRFLRHYSVFNEEQIQGLDVPTAEVPVVSLDDRCADALAYLEAVGARVVHIGARAYYQRQGDFISMPHMHLFVSSEAYLSTRAHETVHWTGAPHRLDRKKGRVFGDKDYAREELVAELGAAFWCAARGLKVDQREDHAAYLGHWIQVLKADSKAIFVAAREAQAAVEYMERMVAASKPTAAAVPAEA